MSGAQHGKTQYVSSVVMYEQCGVCRASTFSKKSNGSFKKEREGIWDVSALVCILDKGNIVGFEMDSPPCTQSSRK